MRLVGVAVAVMVVAGCVRTQTETCGERICPDGMACATYRELTLCVSPEQTAACADLVDGDACTAAGIAGFCHDGACLPIGCGNGRIDDPLFATNEECDDGNRISHDGCSSTCRDEVPRIDELYPYGAFPLTDTAVVTDTSSGTAVMFGGAEYGAAVSSKTWAFIETDWRRLPTRTGPSARRSHGAAYDQRRQRLVMFGGSNTESRFADTWEFDGTAWHPQDPEHKPPPRQNHAMGYDAVRGVTVMFGGRVFGEPGDTWEWDGSDWRERVDAMPQPIARTHQAMAFDPARGVMVMVVENNTEGVLTYELEDDGWHLKAPAELGPSPGTDSPLAFDAVLRRVVTSGATLSAWDGQAWTSIMADAPGRKQSAMTTSADGHLLRVGGHLNDMGMASPMTQRWDGTQWIAYEIPLAPDARPSARVDFDTAYDSRRRRVVMFGGSAITGSLGDTWELGTSGWQRVATTGPSARSGHAMAYDVTRGQTVLYGDTNGDRRTWTWDGVTWTEHPAVLGLDARSFATMAYDPERGVVVLFGGVTTTAFMNDTWEWDGSTWTRRQQTLDRPAERADAALAYDPIRKTMVLFGGRGRDETTRVPIVFGDTWTWDGAAWMRLMPAGVPTPRFGHGLAWDAARARLVLIGGSGDSNVFADPTVNDVWEWDGATWTGVDIVSPTDATRISTTPGIASGILLFVGAIGGIGSLRLQWGADTAYETCTQADHDRDGLVGCADLDCWAICSPLCVPGATCAGGERCGDGTCATHESCRSCPDDCGECPVMCGDGTCSAGEDCVGDCTP